MEETNGIEIKLLEEQVKELKAQNKDLEKRITAIETSRAKTEYQYDQIMRAIDKLNDITIPNVLKEIESLKNKPAKRYESIITAGISGVVAIIISLLFKGEK